MAISERDDQVIEIYAREIANAWPPVSEAQRQRLSVLFSGPWLNDQADDDARQADALEAERARPVPRPDRVVAVDRDDLVELFAFITSRPTILGMGKHAYTAAGRIAAAAGISFP